MTPNIKLQEVDSFKYEGRILYTVQAERVTRYILPSGARVSLMHYKGNSVLEIGGLKSITVRVSGPKKDLIALYEAVT